MPKLTDPLRIGARESKNRLYRAPVLEVAPQGPDAARILARELVPSAAAGCGLVFQGACLVTPRGGRSAPGLLRVHDRDFVLSLRPAAEEVKSHGALLLMQLGFGGLQTMELWHQEYRDAHPTPSSRGATSAAAPRRCSLASRSRRARVDPSRRWRWRSLSSSAP